MIGEGNQLQVEGDLRELPDNHWNRVYTDQGYFDGFAKRPSIQTGASLSPFPETYAKRQANIAYMSSSLGIPIEEMPAVYDAKKNELAKEQMGMPSLSDEGLFNYYKKQFDRENEVNSAATGIYQEVQKSVFESLFKGETANDINNQPTYRPLLEQKLNEAGDLLSDQERLNIREQADKMADNLRRANTSVTDDARWLFDLVSKQTGRGKEYELAGEQPNPAATVGGLGPVMNLAVKQPAPAPEGEMDLNDPEMLNFQTEQVLEKFADMPTEQRKSIYLLAGAFAELNQVDKGVFYQAAESLGRFLTREMGERISRNVTEEMIRGQQRLLDSDIPLYEANNLDGSKGLSQVPTSGQTPLNAEQRAKLKESGTRKLKLLQVKRELVNLADTKIDPIKVVTNWPTWEQGLYGFAGSIPYAAVAAIPFVGFPAITASFFGQYKDDLLLEYPDMDPDQAATISALAAPMAAGLELIQANLLMGKFVSLDRAIKFFLKPSRNPMTRIIARGTASFVAETGVELTQNRVQPIVQTIGAALDEDIPGYNWEKLAEGFDEELGVTAVTMLLFTLTGLPFITSQEINRNADYLKDKKILKYFGASEEQAERVATSLTKEERVENWKDVTSNLDPKLVEAGRRQMFIDTMAQLKEPADPYQPTIRRDGERYTVLDTEGNVVADRVDADTAFYEFERIAGSNETLFASVQAELIDTLLEAGKATNPEGFTERIDVATQEVVNRYNNMTPEQLQRRIAQWERETGQTWQPGAAVNITAVNTLEQVKEGLFQSITRVVKATTPEEIRAVLEDRAEGQYKMALQSGQFAESDMVGWIREYEAGTGDSLLEEDFTSRDVVEAVSTMSVAYYSGNLDNSRVSSRLRAFFEALKEYFTAIFARGVRIKEAIAAGQIAPEFEAFLAQSVGLDLDRQIEVQAAQQAVADINSGASEAAAPAELKFQDPTFSVRIEPPPQKTITAYKLFKTKPDQPGKLFPLFIGKTVPAEIGVWYNADSIPTKSFAERPGWHAGDTPSAMHIGARIPGSTKPSYRRNDEVWAEIEMSADVDWQPEANRRGTNKDGKLVPSKADIKDQLPKDGFYRYKTNPNMRGEWLIGGAIKINRILSDQEVASINEANGTQDLPRIDAGGLVESTFAISVNVAPVRSDRLDKMSKGEVMKRAKSPKFIHLQQIVTEVAAAYGVSISARYPVIGGWTENGQPSLEVPEAIVFETDDLDMATEMAALIAISAPELQNAAFVWKYDENGQDTEYRFQAKSSEAAMQIAQDLEAAGVQGFSYDPKTREFSIVAVGKNATFDQRLYDFTKLHTEQGRVGSRGNIKTAVGTAQFPGEADYRQAIASSRVRSGAAGAERGQALRAVADRAERRLDRSESAKQSAAQAKGILQTLAQPRMAASRIQTELKGRQFDNIRAFGLWLDERFNRQVKKSAFDIGSKDGLENASNALVYDVLDGLSTDGSGMGWYDERVQETLRELAALHPEFNDDPYSLAVYIGILAATSQGYTVMQTSSRPTAFMQTSSAKEKFPKDTNSRRAVRPSTATCN